MAERKAEIPVKPKLRDKLRRDKGEDTWDDYLEKLSDTYNFYRKAGRKMVGDGYGS